MSAENLSSLDPLSRTTSHTHIRTESNASRPRAATAAPLLGLLESNGTPSMFDSANAANLDISDPQSLSAAPEPVIQSVIDHHGAVELIKRLSAALAERDAHITALTRLAQEWNVPTERVAETAVRVKQAERRRLELASAAAEDVLDGSGEGSVVGSDSGESHSLKNFPEKVGVMKGMTRFFGGTGKRRESNVQTPASSRSTSRPARRTDRPLSIDVRSIRSEDTTASTEGNGWTTAIFGGNFPKRNDSLENRMPVEMTTRHDRDQLPPTLSNQFDDPQEAEWNAFLVKLVEARQKHGSSGDISGVEMIGASHFGREGNEGRKKMEQLTRLVIGGIPMKLRHAIWMELSNTQAIMKPDAYAYYLSLQEENGGHAELDAILKDVPRTLTSKYDFYSGKGFARLKAVLVAFVARYPHLGYTQGLNTIAGYLLLAIPSEEDAFWVLCNIVENYFPPDYFSRVDAMISPLADNVLLRQFIKELLPNLNDHLDNKLKIQPPHTAPLKWFFTAFSNALPESTAMRVWDVWLCLSAQKNFLFAFALALLSHNSDGILACEDEGAYFSFLDGKLDLPERPEEILEIVKVAWRIGRKLGRVDERRREIKENMGLENKLRRRRTGSLEVLVGGENGDVDVNADGQTAAAAHE